MSKGENILNRNQAHTDDIFQEGYLETKTTKNKGYMVKKYKPFISGYF